VVVLAKRQRRGLVCRCPRWRSPEQTVLVQRPVRAIEYDLPDRTGNGSGELILPRTHLPRAVNEPVTTATGSRNPEGWSTAATTAQRPSSYTP
jgi:hypothetical protein